jgi:hypothetical protein
LTDISTGGKGQNALFLYKYLSQSTKSAMYYVYSYLREDNSPYYIGKGTKGRAYSYSNHRVKAPKNKSQIHILKNNLTEEEAYELEKLYILMFGRKDLGTGILRNLSDGGEGPTGYKPTPEQRKKIALSRMGEKHPLYGISPSEETREKQKKSLKGKYTKEKNSMYGKTHTKGSRDKISQRHKGVPKSEQHRKKISEGNKGRIVTEETRNKLKKLGKVYKFTLSSGETFIDTIPEFCRKYNYHKGAVRYVSQGKANRHKDVIKVEEVWD